MAQDNGKKPEGISLQGGGVSGFFRGVVDRVAPVSALNREMRQYRLLFVNESAALAEAIQPFAPNNIAPTMEDVTNLQAVVKIASLLATEGVEKVRDHVVKCRPPLEFDTVLSVMNFVEHGRKLRNVADNSITFGEELGGRSAQQNKDVNDFWKAEKAIVAHIYRDLMAGCNGEIGRLAQMEGWSEALVDTVRMVGRNQPELLNNSL